MELWRSTQNRKQKKAGIMEIGKLGNTEHRTQERTSQKDRKGLLLNGIVGAAKEEQHGRERRAEHTHSATQRNVHQHQMPPQPIHTAETATTTPLAQKLRKLASGVHSELDKRDWYYSDNSNPARYAFFAFMGLAIIVAIMMICMVNVRRMRAGRAPVISSYLAPPNYHQSQVQYEGQTTTNLPTYTPAPNPNQDVGYYDKNGNFIPSTTIVADPSQSTSTADVEMSNNPFSSATPDQSQTPYTSQQPYQSSNMPSAYTQSPAINEPQSVGDMSYRRPTGPPPNRTYTHSVTGAGAGAGGSTSNAVGSTSAEAGAVDELPPYVEPETPQMSHYKN